MAEGRIKFCAICGKSFEPEETSAYELFYGGVYEGEFVPDSEFAVVHGKCLTQQFPFNTYEQGE